MVNQEVIVIHPYLKNNRVNKSQRLSEAINLVEAINLECKYSSSVGLLNINSNTFVNKGYVNILKNKVDDLKTQLLYLNTNLSPIQQRNLENALKCKVIDRTGLILEIFGSRAKSNEGKLSVKLASLQFQKSRLVRSWTHLERQRGGAGFMGGPGEKQIESDKRQITEQINRIKKKIKKIDNIRNIQRDRRIKNNIPIISLVGYTNSGKSTLFNLLTRSNVLSKDMLFASLDSTIRKTRINNFNLVFVDTVGFIRDLPTNLIDAFKSTLDEIVNSDLILHIRDSSDDEYLLQKKDVLKILFELGIRDDDPRIMEVNNKIDLLEDNNKNFKSNGIRISAISGEGISYLKSSISEKLEILYKGSFLLQQSYKT